MVANHLHDAFAQLRKLQEVILERRRFRGYSGEAQLLGGLVALAETILLAGSLIPPRPFPHLIAWGTVAITGLLLNYGALAWWFYHDPARRRDLLALKPAIDAIPALAAGAVLTAAIATRCWFAPPWGADAAAATELINLLPGIWMICYGLAKSAGRLALPPGIFIIGIAYIAAGTLCLACHFPFTNPWPMGIAFFLGETLSGWLLIRDRQQTGDTP